MNKQSCTVLKLRATFQYFPACEVGLKISQKNNEKILKQNLCKIIKHCFNYERILYRYVLHTCKINNKFRQGFPTEKL